MVAELEHLLPVMRGAPRSDSICLCLLGGPVWARLGLSGPVWARLGLQLPLAATHNGPGNFPAPECLTGNSSEFQLQKINDVGVS